MRRAIGLIVLAMLAMLAMSPEQACRWPIRPRCSACRAAARARFRTGARGQYGVCRLPDGRVVDEWAYYRTMKRKAAAASRGFRARMDFLGTPDVGPLLFAGLAAASFATAFIAVLHRRGRRRAVARHHGDGAASGARSFRFIPW